MIGRLKRQVRLGEFNLLVAGVFVVGIVLTAVGTFSDRLERAMQERTSAILGADGLISSTRPLDESYARMAEEFDLEVAHSVSFMSMVLSESGSQLAGVRAVSSEYPLRGKVVLNRPENESQAQQSTGTAPRPGLIWAATPLLKSLKLDAVPTIQLGDAKLKFEEEILMEPEGGVGMLRLAPRVLMNIQDLDKTGLITPASRARYRLLVAGTSEALKSFEQAIEPILKPYESWRIADIRRDEVKNTVGRIVSYIRLAVLLSVILSVVAMALAAQGLWGQQVNEVALLRCLGQKHLRTLGFIVQGYLAAAVPASLAGAATGFFLQAIAAGVMQGVTGIILPPSSWIPGLLSVLLCLAALGTVMLPILFAVRHVPALTLLRTGQADNMHKSRIAVYSILVLIIFLTLFLARNLALASAVLAGFFLAAILLWSIIRIFIVAARRVTRPSATPWYMAIKALCSNPARSTWIASTFGAIMFALVLLGVARNDIFDAWQNSVPPDAPNIFLINIKDSNKTPLQQILSENGVRDIDIFAVIRGRITEINNQAVTGLDFGTEESRHRINHEFNLTELSELPVDNKVISGKWFEQGEMGFSIERETAMVLELEIGDMISIDAGGKQYSAPITSLRDVKWDNMRPNFFIIASPGVLTDAPRSFISSIYVKDYRSELVLEISRLFPNITAIDLGMLLERFRNLARQGSAVISVIFLFTLISAILVFVGILQSQEDARKREIALLKSMGATRRFIRSAILAEFAFLGLIAGTVGSILAMLSSMLLAQQLFDFPFSIPWRWLLISVCAGVFIVSASGYISIRKLLDEIPNRLLSPGLGNSDRARSLS